MPDAIPDSAQFVEDGSLAQQVRYNSLLALVGELLQKNEHLRLEVARLESERRDLQPES